MSMSEGINDDRRTLLTLLRGVKFSIDRGNIAKDEQSFQQIRNIVMKLEGIVYLASPSRHGRYRINRNNFEQINKEVKELINDSYFSKNISYIPFRSVTPESSAPISFLVDRNSNINDALTLIIEITETHHELVSHDLFTETSNDSVRLRKLVPAQKIAPVQFDIKDGRLVISPKLSKAKKR